MKQFAHCTNCQQWYVGAFTTAVETYQDDHLHRVTIWCLRCIDETEKRSRAISTHESVSSDGHHDVDGPTDTVLAGIAPSEEFQQFMQEHSDLMERAIREDDDVLVPIVEDFMHRCHTYQQQTRVPEQAQRLLGHMQYWKAFLKALNQSR
ncbi:MAG: hypothetical protein V3S24_02175 [Candidatus Tectomicrobia bacterium]